MRFPKEAKLIRSSELPFGVPKYKNHIYIYKDLEKGLFFSSRTVVGVVEHLQTLNKSYDPNNLYKIVNDDGTNVLVSDHSTINYFDKLKKEE